MQNNFFFLRQLTPSLAAKLNGFTLVSCFSQNKDELVIEFNNAVSSFFLRATLSSSFCCLSFPENFARAGKNSVDLFPQAILKKVKGLHQYENERSFSIHLEDDIILLFKMHGSRGNVVLFENKNVAAIFRKHLIADNDTNLLQLDRKINWSKENFLDHLVSPEKEYPTLGKPVWNYLQERGFNDASPETKWSLFSDTILKLNSPDYFICEDATGISFYLFPFGNILKKFMDPVRAITDFYFAAVSSRSFHNERISALKSLQSSLSGGEAYISKNAAKLHEIEKDDRYKVWADLIMANIHVIKNGADKALVDDFSGSNLPVEIPLKPLLSPQKNAEVYYRKSRNQRIEIQKLKESITAREKELAGIHKKIELLEHETSLKGLRLRMGEEGVRERSSEKQPAPLPYRESQFKGFRIWIGRNAESNDKLTQKYSHKDDLWLHAKDVAGSHVLLKYQSGKNFPKDVIEHAAELAAFHSKRKNETLCPVAYTLKKYVRKRKGDPAGAVVVEREEVILVSPKNHV